MSSAESPSGNTGGCPSFTVPDARRQAVERALAGFRRALDRAPSAPALPADADDRLRVAFAASDFLAGVARSQPGTVAELLTRRPAESRDRAHFRRLLAERLGDPPAETADLYRELRRFRAAESARIAWRDLFGLGGIDDLLAEQSALADACIGEALVHLEAAAHQRHGVPRDADGAAQSLVVLGMGKLGGGELNFSSDIDLIFVHGRPGATDGARPLDNADFFTRLGRQLIQALDERTADGFVYRVDMRLRPFGASGPLVVHLGQFEQYLVGQAREWERFALVKARPLTGPDEAIGELAGMLRPFVFRRYLDFGAFEALRDLKRRLEREVARKGLSGNVKYGRGGIREIEFIGQAFQLIRGGREPRLRTRGLLPALDALVASGELSATVVAELAAAYRLLRRIENHLQLFADERVHALPRDAAGRARLAWTLGHADWHALAGQLDDHMGRVHGHFKRVFNVPGDDEPPAVLSGVWEAELDDDDARARLAEAGFDDAGAVLARLQTVRTGTRYRNLSATARERLDRLMPLILADAGATRMAEQTLNRLLTLLEAIAPRSVYLSLLIEHAGARERLVQLCAASPWIATFVAGHPILLDELLDSSSLFEAPDRASVDAEVADALEGIDRDDLEAQMDALRQVRQVNVLRVAAMDITGRLPLMRVSDHLTWIAESMLAAVHEPVREQLVARHGRPRMRRDDGTVTEPGLGIVAYGKLGGLELGYGSDLDLVFLHDAEGEDLGTDGERSLDNGVFFGRLTQRIIHFLATVTPAGILYEIDTRLRPNGSSGALVSSIGAFARYQAEKAWTWEHQALVRSRMVIGHDELRRRFDAVRSDILTREREAASLRAEVVAMRARMRRELARESPASFDLKQGAGGVADIEFVVQYGALCWSRTTPALIEYTDNIRLLEAMADAGHLTADEARMLTDAYRTYRARIHRLALLGESAVVEPDEELETARAAVIGFWRSHMEPAGH